MISPSRLGRGLPHRSFPMIFSIQSFCCYSFNMHSDYRRFSLIYVTISGADNKLQISSVSLRLRPQDISTDRSTDKFSNTVTLPSDDQVIVHASQP